MKEGWRAGGRDGEWGRDGEREGWRREGWRRRNRDRGMSGRKYGMKQLQEYYCRKGRFQELRRASDTVCRDTDTGIQIQGYRCCLHPLLSASFQVAQKQDGAWGSCRRERGFRCQAPRCWPEWARRRQGRLGQGGASSSL